jgi:hypothetical protein
MVGDGGVCVGVDCRSMSGVKLCGFLSIGVALCDLGSRSGQIQIDI